ncbi:TonB family protein [Marinilabiliaceae bacterium JC017]|nr:TonB family protein [Marinilabiliaceae bacterium JC017]
MNRSLKLVLVCLFFSLMALGQKTLKETLVEPPKFNPEKAKKTATVEITSPICLYMEDELIYPEEAIKRGDEGVVIVYFTVFPNGSVGKFEVKNSVSRACDEAVISVIKTTDGKWIPGMVNNKPTEMEKMVNVVFDIPENPTHNEMAISFYRTGLRSYYKGCQKESDLMVNNSQRKSSRHFNRAINHFNNALQFQPNEPSIVFGLARTYEKLGQKAMVDEKLEEFLNILANKQIRNELTDKTDLAIITPR